MDKTMVEINPVIVNAMIQIIDVAASKGTFVGADITNVGRVREELVAAIKGYEEKQMSFDNLESDGE